MRVYISEGATKPQLTCTGSCCLPPPPVPPPPPSESSTSQVRLPTNEAPATLPSIRIRRREPQLRPRSPDTPEAEEKETILNPPEPNPRPPQTLPTQQRPSPGPSQFEPHFRLAYRAPPRGKRFSQSRYKQRFRNDFLNEIREHGAEDLRDLVEDIKGLDIDRAEYTPASAESVGGVNVWLRFTCNNTVNRSNTDLLYHAIEKFTKVLFHLQKTKAGGLSNFLYSVCSNGSFFNFEPIQERVRHSWYRNFILEIMEDGGQLLSCSTNVFAANNTKTWLTGIVFGLHHFRKQVQLTCKTTTKILANSPEHNRSEYACIFVKFTEELWSNIKETHDSIKRSFPVEGLDVKKCLKDYTRQSLKVVDACNLVENATNELKDSINKKESLGARKDIELRFIGTLLDYYTCVGNLVSSLQTYEQALETSQNREIRSAAVNGVATIGGFAAASYGCAFYAADIIQAAFQVGHPAATVCAAGLWLVAVGYIYCGYGKPMFDSVRDCRALTAELEKIVAEKKSAGGASEAAFLLDAALLGSHFSQGTQKRELLSIAPPAYDRSAVELAQAYADERTRGQADDALLVYIENCLAQAKRLRELLKGQQVEGDI